MEWLKMQQEDKGGHATSVAELAEVELEAARDEMKRESEARKEAAVTKGLQKVRSLPTIIITDTANIMTDAAKQDSLRSASLGLIAQSKRTLNK